MDDGPERATLGNSSTLATALIDLDTLVGTPYRNADRAALRQQSLYRLLAAVAAVAGTLAVVLAIVQLTFDALPHPPETLHRWVRYSEPGAAAMALVAVLIGIGLKLHRGWLVDRYRAQRYRLTKFRLLADARLWCGDTVEWRHAAADEAARIAGLDGHEVERLARQDSIAGVPREFATCPISPPDAEALVAYYVGKRITVQRGYFLDSARRFARREHVLRSLGPGLFFVSVAAALGHFVLDQLGGHTYHEASLFLVTAAAVLPTIAGGIRIHRGAYEFGRSAALFEAKAEALGQFAARLEQSRGDGAAVLRVLQQCEDFLEDESREWLRLMFEAEFY